MKLKRPDPILFKTQPIEPHVAIQLQNMSISEKEYETYIKLTEWYYAWQGRCYVSFSGGKDSTVMAYLAANCFKENGWTETPLILMFCDTGLEYPEIREFVSWYAKWLQEKFPEVNIKLEFHGLLDKTKHPAQSKMTLDDSQDASHRRHCSHFSSIFAFAECSQMPSWQ